MFATLNLTGRKRRVLRVFLAHSSRDKAHVREVFHLLKLDGFEPWLDDENLVAGQHWELEVERAVRDADAVVVFLSSRAVDSVGYIHKEIRMALDAAERQPQGAKKVVPIRLDQHEVPRNLEHLHWIDSSSARWYPPGTKIRSLFDDSEIVKFSIGNRYLQLQRALVARECELDSGPHVPSSPF